MSDDHLITAQRRAIGGQTAYSITNDRFDNLGCPDSHPRVRERRVEAVTLDPAKSVDPQRGADG